MSSSDGLRRQAARFLTPCFLLFALLAGGASLEGEAIQAILFTISGLVIAALLAFSGGWVRGPVITAFIFVGLFVLLLTAQLVPLGREMIAALPDRDKALASLAALGVSPERLTLSLAPEATLAGALAFLAPLAGFSLVAAIKWSRGAGVIKWVIPGFGAAGSLLGLLQVILGKSVPGLYFYEITNIRSPVGVFANANHQASFLLMCLPFVAALGAQLRRDWEGSDADSGRAAYVIVTGLMILAGILGAGSLAGYLLLVPVLGLSVAVFLAGDGRKEKRGALPLLLLPLLLGFAALVVFSSPRLTGLGALSTTEGPLSRAGMNEVSSEIFAVHWQAGTGLGTWRDVYRLYEDPETVSRVFHAHGHNDYLEWAIETGAAGMLLLFAFMMWWLVSFMRLWMVRGREGFRLRRAASIACLVPILHSLVDYPLRTPGIASLAAICLALMLVPRPRREIPMQETASDSEENITTVNL